MATKVVTGVCRASYAHIWQARRIQADQPPKYSVAILIPKSDTDTVKKIKDAIAVEISGVFGSKPVPASYKQPLKDGDQLGKDETKDHWVLNASSKDKPGIVDSNRNDIIDPAKVYSGCYCRFQIAMAPYNMDLNKGIGCYLNHVQFVKDGPSLSGREDPKSAFDDGVALPSDDEALS